MAVFGNLTHLGSIYIIFVGECQVFEDSRVDGRVYYSEARSLWATGSAQIRYHFDGTHH